MDTVRELIQYLNAQEDQIVNIALENLLPYTQTSKGHVGLFRENDLSGARALKRLSLSSRSREIVRNALIALINLTDDAEIRYDLASDAGAVIKYAEMVSAVPKLPYVKFVSMLLCNLARESEALDKLNGQPLTRMAMTFAAPANVTDLDLDYLGFTFGEAARRNSKAVTGLLPYLAPMLILGSLNRRKAVAAAVKNCLFDVQSHRPLAHETPLIDIIMICLLGNETYAPDEVESMPPSVRENLGSNKQRESDIPQQLLLLECLLLLSSSQDGRDAMRQKNTYYVIRELHKSSDEPELLEAAVQFVNMVMRGDPNDRAQSPAIEEAIAGGECTEANDSAGHSSVAVLSGPSQRGDSQPKRQKHNDEAGASLDDDDDDEVVEIV